MTMKQPFQDGAAFIDGCVVEMSEARIPITDTGFTRSDLTYDVVSVWDGAFFRLEDHLTRFERNCRRLRLSLPYSRDELRQILIELIETSRLREAYVEVICTRGQGVDGSRDPRTFVNRFYAFAIPYVWILRPEDAEAGMDVAIAKTARRIPTESVDPTVKNFHWGDLTRGLFEAYDRGANHALLLDHAGNLTEGPGYNVFAVIDGRLLTPATGVLEGITRRTVLELARSEGLETQETHIAEAALRSATELFATSTAGGVMPITRLDGSPVASGQVGDVTRRMRELYWAAHVDGAFVTRVLPSLLGRPPCPDRTARPVERRPRRRPGATGTVCCARDSTAQRLGSGRGHSHPPGVVADVGPRRPGPREPCPDRLHDLRGRLPDGCDRAPVAVDLDGAGPLEKQVDVAQTSRRSTRPGPQTSPDRRCDHPVHLRPSPGASASGQQPRAPTRGDRSGTPPTPAGGRARHRSIRGRLPASAGSPPVRRARASPATRRRQGRGSRSGPASPRVCRTASRVRWVRPFPQSARARPVEQRVVSGPVSPAAARREIRGRAVARPERPRGA